MPMTYEVCEDRHNPERWRAEASDYASEGECFCVIFTGARAKDRAIEYAAWKNAQPWHREAFSDNPTNQPFPAKPPAAAVQSVA